MDHVKEALQWWVVIVGSLEVLLLLCFLFGFLCILYKLFVAKNHSGLDLTVISNFKKRLELEKKNES